MGKAVHWSRKLKDRVDKARAQILLERCTQILERNMAMASLLLRRRKSYTDAFYDLWETLPPLPGEIAGRFYLLDCWARCTLSQQIVRVASLHCSGPRGKSLLTNLVITVQGRRGTGKTTYSFWCTAAGLYEIGFKPEEAVDYARSFIMWKETDLLALLIALSETRAWIPVVILDDAGAWFTKHWIFGSKRERRGMVALSRMLDTMKDLVGVVVLTTPAFRKLASFLREFSDYVVTAQTVDDRGRIMNQFLWSSKLPATTSSGSDVDVGNPFIDLTPPDALMPDDVWARMMEARAELRSRQLTELAEAIEEKEEAEELLGGDGYGEG